MVNSRALIRDSRRKHDHERSDERSQRVKTTLGSNITKMENGAYKETLNWFVQNRRLNQNVHAGRNLLRVRESCATSLVLWRMHGSSCFSKCLVPSIFYCDSERCVFFIRFLKNLEFRSVGCWVKFFSSFFFSKHVLSVGNCFSRPDGGPFLVFLVVLSSRPSHQPRMFYDVNASEEFVFYVLHTHSSSPSPLGSSTGVWFVRKYSVWIGGSILRCHLRPTVCTIECTEKAFGARQRTGEEQDSKQILS